MHLALSSSCAHRACHSISSYRQLRSSCDVFFSYMSGTVNVNMLSLYLYSDLLAKVKFNLQKQTKLSCIHCPWFAVAHHANTVLPFVDPFVCLIPYPWLVLFQETLEVPPNCLAFHHCGPGGIEEMQQIWREQCSHYEASLVEVFHFLLQVPAAPVEHW